MDQEIEGLKLIYLTGKVNLPDDLSLPYRLEGSFRPPPLMGVTFAFLHGSSEEIILRSQTREALDEFIKLNNLETHPRLRSLTITGPNGVELEVTNKA